MKTMIKLFSSIIFSSFLLMNAVHAAPIQFSKVVFFGDSLTDIGDNQDGLTDQAPITNKVLDPTSGKYINGNTWAVPFVKDLIANGYLNAQSTGDVKPSILYDQQVEIKPTDSVDFAYSGDASDGYPLINGHYVIEYHPVGALNDHCTPNVSPIPADANALCGAKNRIRDYITKHPVDPNALYVIWIGANDILQQLAAQMQADIQKAMTTGHPVDQATWNQLQQQAVKMVLTTTGNIAYAVYELQSAGAKYFMVPNLPNLAYTPAGFKANYLYSLFFPSQKDVVLNTFTTLTTNFNNELKNELNSIPTSFPIAQPDINKLFVMARSGQLGAFPNTSSVVNANPVLEWMDTCCSNQEDSRQVYDPAQCNAMGAEVCTGPLPQLPNNAGHFLFYNDIHPTTCAAKYIAKFFESYLPGGQGLFVPSQNLCDTNE